MIKDKRVSCVVVLAMAVLVLEASSMSDARSSGVTPSRAPIWRRKMD